jgi:hypothetical protein
MFSRKNDHPHILDTLNRIDSAPFSRIMKKKWDGSKLAAELRYKK